MKNCITVVAWTTLLAMRVNGASAVIHDSGDNALAGPITTANFNQVVAANGNQRQIERQTYVGAFSALRQQLRDDPYFNESIDAVPDRTLFELGIVSSGGGSSTMEWGFVGSDAEFLDIVVGANVSQLNISFEFLGQFDSGGAQLLSPGFTGRWAGTDFVTPPFHYRGIAFRNRGNTTGGQDEVVGISMTAGSDSLAGGDYYEFNGFGTEWFGPGDPQVNGFGTGTVSGIFDENEGLYFHNGADLGDLLQRVDYVVTPEGAFFEEGTTFRFTFDAMTTAGIPEVSTSILFPVAASIMIFSRRRKLFS